jgi:hypothetical protein
MVGGTSLQEARQLYELLQECMVLLDRVEVKATRTSVSLSRVLTLTNSILIMLDRAGYGKDYEETIKNIRAIIMLLQRLQAVAVAANMAITGGPLGLVLGAVSIGVIAFSSIDMAGSSI